MAGPETDIGIVIKAKIDNAIRQFKKLRLEIESQRKGVNKTLDGFKGLDRFWLLMAAGSMAAVIAAFGRMASEMQKVQFQVAAFIGGFERVPETMERVLALAKRAPFDLDTMTKTFVRLKASGIDPIINDQGEGPLKNLADAVAAFGGGPEIFQRAGIAIQQMAGKGVISMEELRQQLGEAIPTAMRIMAEQLNMSVGQMIQRISKGQLTFEEGFEALDKGFKETFGGLSDLITEGSFLGQITQMKNRFQEIANVFVETGGLDVFTAMLRLLNIELGNLTEKLKDVDMGKLLIDALERAAPTVDRIIDSMSAFGTAISTIASQIAGIISGFPPELVVGGLAGFFLFGKFIGRGPAAALGILMAGLTDTSNSVIRMIKTVLDGVPDEIKSTGFIVWFFFGKIPAIVLGIAAVVKSLVDITASGLFALFDTIEQSIKGLFTNIEDAQLSFGERWKKNFEAQQKASEERGEGLKKFWKETFNKIFPSDGNEQAKKSGAAAANDFAAGFDESQGLLKNVGLKAGQGLGSGFVEGVKNQIEIVVNAMKAINSRQPDNLGGLRPTDIQLFSKLVTGIENARAKMEGFGGAIQRNFSEANKIAKQFDGILKRIGQDVQKAKDAGKFEGNIKKGLEDATAEVIKFKNEWLGVNAALRQKMETRNLEKLNQQLDRTKEAVDKMDPSLGIIDREVAKVDNRFAGLRLRLQQIERNIKEGMIPGSEAGEKALARVRAELARLDKLHPEAQLKAIGDGLDKMAAAAQRAEDNLKRFQNQLKSMQMELNDDEVGQAGQAVQNRIDSAVAGINREIARVTKDPILSDEAKQKTIENLEAVRQKTEEVGEKLKAKAEFMASSFGQFAMKVGASIEDALADSFEALATRSKSAKEIILDLYASITKAAARYLAQQAMIAAFGAPGASGPGAGQAGFAQMFGSLFGFQHGGQFIVGGTGGPDSQVVAFKATPGEQVSITPPGGGGATAPVTFNINALDGRSVQQLLYEQSDTISSLLMGRSRLNKS